MLVGYTMFKEFLVGIQVDKGCFFSAKVVLKGGVPMITEYVCEDGVEWKVVAVVPRDELLRDFEGSRVMFSVYRAGDMLVPQPYTVLVQNQLP